MDSTGLKRETAKPKESVRTRCLDELVAAVKQREERIQEEEIIVRQDVRPVSGKPFTKYQVIIIITVYDIIVYAEKQ